MDKAEKWIKPKISKEFNFSRDAIKELVDEKYSQEWPIVYMIFNKKEMYIGETVDAETRML